MKILNKIKKFIFGRRIMIRIDNVSFSEDAKHGEIGEKDRHYYIHVMGSEESLLKCRGLEGNSADLRMRTYLPENLITYLVENYDDVIAFNRRD